jgi:hypothetical protein
MVISPGEEILADDITSRRRVATGYEDTDSAAITTVATVIATATGNLVAGRTYHIRLITHLGSSVSSDTANLNIKEDTVSGTELQGAAALPLVGSASAGIYYQISTDYTAVATGSKTFVGTLVRSAGSGNVRREAAAIRPTYLTVDYAYG